MCVSFPIDFPSVSCLFCSCLLCGSVVSTREEENVLVGFPLVFHPINVCVARVPFVFVFLRMKTHASLVGVPLVPIGFLFALILFPLVFVFFSPSEKF